VRALLLVSSAMLRNLSFGSEPNACAIAANSPEYGFCSDLMPSVEEMVSSFGLPCTDAASWQAQNCIANIRINYNTSRASNLPTTLSHRPGKTIAPKGSLLAACFERKAQEQILPLRTLSCLLLKPVSTRSPLPRSAYRPTRASVLSSHIEGVVSCHQAITSIIRCAPWV
jgi:hypothetical protein